MDVVKVRTCTGSNYIEIQLDWQYEGEKHCSIVAMPLEHFRKEDMWSIVRMLLDAAENQSKKKEEKPEWISVNDRLPKIGERVLCWWVDRDGGYYGFAAYQGESKWYVSNEGMPHVTHWMHLPPAPKEDA